MELSRWGFAKLTQVSDRYRDFKQFLADVLEGDRSLLGETQSEKHVGFSVRDDIECLLYESPLRQPFQSQRLQAMRETKLEAVCFHRLAPFFEAGFMLETNMAGSAMNHAKHRAVTLQSMFLFGKVFQPRANEAPNLELSLPKFALNHVYRGRIDPVLRVFRLEALSNLVAARAFAFSPRQGLIFLLICNRPHPWQMAAIETGFLSCSEIGQQAHKNQRGDFAGE